MAKGKWDKWLTSDGLSLLGGWARDGLSDEQISHNMGISRSTLSDWKNKFTDIFNILRDGKEIVDIQVENALLKRALGYKYNETTQGLVTDKETGEVSLAVTKIVTKEVAPDISAQMFWLKNRRSDKWRSKVTDRDNESGDDEEETGIVVIAPLLGDGDE